MNQSSTVKLCFSGIIDSTPLTLAIIPWGFLFGALAIEAQLTVLQSQLMSLIIYAGAAQLSAVSIIKTSADFSLLMGSTAVINSRHLLYCAALQRAVKNRPLFQRLTIAMFLTDQLFAVIEHKRNHSEWFSYTYAMSAGIYTFIAWNISTYLGIFASQQIPNIQNMGLDFAIIATFIAITVPKMNRLSVTIGAMSSGLSAIIFSYLNIANTLMISAFLGMLVSYLASEWQQIKSKGNH